MRVGKKLIMAMAVISIVPSLIVAMVVNINMQRSIHILQEDSIVSLANVVSAHIYDFCNGQEMDSRFFGQVSTYVECLQARKRGDGPEIMRYWDGEVKKLFQQTTIINDNIDGGALIDINGTVLLSYDENQEGKSVAQTEMFRSIKEGQELYRSSMVNEDGSKNINLVVPVKDEQGQLLGMLQRIVNLSNLNLYIEEVHIGDTGYVYVIDEDASLIYHGAEEKMDLAVGEFQDRQQLDALIDQVKKGELKKADGIVQYDNRGVDTIAAYNQIEELGWVVLVSMDNDEVQGMVDVTTRNIGIVSIMVGLTTAFACYFIIQSMLLPITNIRERFKKITQGDYTVRCDTVKSDEFKDIVEGINDMAYKLQKGEAELERAKTHDPLTGVYNRVGILETTSKRLHQGAKQAVMLMDLDDFATINETLGQKVADGVMLEIAEKLKKLPENICHVGRFSGDSFLILVEDWNEDTEPAKLAAHLRNEIEQIRFVEEHPVHLTSSIGVSYIEDSELELNVYLKHCSAALHKAKKSGKNTDVVFSDEF